MSRPGINDSTSTQRLLSLCGMETTVKKTPGSEKKLWEILNNILIVGKTNNCDISILIIFLRAHLVSTPCIHNLIFQV